MGNKILLIDYEDISYFQAEDKYVRVCTGNGKKYLCDSSLSKLEKTLPHPFIRIHRSYIVNRTYIYEIEKFFKGKIILKLNDKDETSLLTGATCASDVKNKLGI